MPCIPQTPIAQRFLDSGWITPTTAIDTTNSLVMGKPPYAEVLTLPSVSTTTSELGTIRQIQIEETASSAANIKKADLYVLLWTRTTSAPTAPVANAVYNPVTTNYIATFKIAETDYVRWSDTVWTATVNPNRIFKSGGDAVSTDMVAVILSNESGGVTYAASAQLRLRVITEPAA